MLMPAEATVRFGDPITINCTSSAPAILGIIWQASIGEATLADVTVATWSLRQMTEWSGEAKCVLNLGDRLCSKVPVITLYSEHDSIGSLKLRGIQADVLCAEMKGIGLL